VTARPSAIIDLSPGVPDLSTFPRAAWLRAERVVLAGLSGRALGYGDPQGDPGLRAELAPWLARTRGVRAAPEDLVVVNGVAQALALIARVLLRRGDESIAVEDPGSRGARDQLAYWGLAPVPVPVDRDGLRADELARTDARSVVLTPAHQFPTGVVLAPERRRSLLDWAAGGRLLVEDDYDAEYRYDRAPVGALQASAPHLVAYAGSTSKTLAPALRLGWLAAPPSLRAALVAAKHASDLGSPALPQRVLAHLISTGEYDRHVRRVRTRHRARRDALRAALAALLPGAQVHGVAAGLHLLVTLPTSLRGQVVDDRRLAEELLEVGVVAHPLSWHRVAGGAPGLVLGYAATSPDRLQEAVARISKLLSRSGRQARSPASHG
jgi:GntR family transcriptional regulator/MocR family aminotransferase